MIDQYQFNLFPLSHLASIYLAKKTWKWGSFKIIEKGTVFLLYFHCRSQSERKARDPVCYRFSLLFSLVVSLHKKKLLEDYGTLNLSHPTMCTDALDFPLPVPGASQ